MSTNQKVLKVFSYLYLITIIILIVAAVLAFIPATKDIFKDFKLPNEEGLKDVHLDRNVIIGIGLLISALPNLLYFGLLRRAVKNGNKTTFLLVLLSLGLGGSIYSLIKTIPNGFNMTVANSIFAILVDGIIFYNVVKVRSAAEED